MARPAVEHRRRIPSVDALLRSEPGRRAGATFGRALLKRTLTRTLDEVRAGAARGVEPPEDDVILARAIGAAATAAIGLGPVINATGVVLHTGLGRAPLPPAALEAAVRAAAGYADLEVERQTGRRGRRGARAELLAASLTGAEDGLVVNNGAAGLLLTLAALARGKHVLVSRGELIEIGGEFRIPDILAASGARLVEVGTTNRTRVTDFRRALSDKTALILKVHPSNYRVVGFTAAPSAADLAKLAGTAGIPFGYDLGSGLLDHVPGVPDDEPSAAGALRDGADLVVFSGDKLLGGPQAGLVLGRADLIARLRRHPIARAVRVDKMQVAALESVLATHAAGRRDDLPVWRMLREPTEDIRHRAEALAIGLDGDLEGAHVVACESAVGGGSLPGYAMPSFGVEVRTSDPNAFSARLRSGSPPVFCRVTERGVLLDVRTVRTSEIPDLTRAIQYALEADELDDE
ncbi:MAG TPA: L-seryl-tRNA(Sec) selenium transferase [Actinomycetota bacterium]|nr:L-seryl-tRNA(Sec) selenium transferase [Actinomycetota bacterium]